jgi:hypothetical protein
MRASTRPGAGAYSQQRNAEGRDEHPNPGTTAGHHKLLVLPAIRDVRFRRAASKRGTRNEDGAHLSRPSSAARASLSSSSSYAFCSAWNSSAA